MTIEHFYNEFKKKLAVIYDKREASNIADWVFENATGYNNLHRSANSRKEIPEEIYATLQIQLNKLLQHKPVQYVLHEAWFYKMKFFVNEHVLIPRPETEELVSWIIDDVKNSATQKIKILDIGTGSGCIAIALNKNVFNADVTAIDTSEAALDVSKQNAFNLGATINFIQKDFLNKEFSGMLHRYDVIVSNPPYIPMHEKSKLAKNVTDHEPSIALFVSNDDPFIFYKAIANFSQTHLNSGGKIYVEIHEDFADQIEKIFIENDFLPETRNDIYGKKRMIKAIKK